MIKKVEIDIDVVEMAKIRIINIFKNGIPVVLSISGGKDSICLTSLIYDLCREGKIDKSLLTICFIDEEAIYDCVEQIVKEWRLKFLELGVKFDRWCIEVKHFNCFNTLTQDESFICWDRYKKDVWVRKKPPFALDNPPDLYARQENYQSFAPRHYKGSCLMMGVRASESLQRSKNIANKRQNNDLKFFPIYDWKDTDVWQYIYKNNLNFPNAYIYLYQTGSNRKDMRISQFFSVDTAKSLVKMNEYYPNLFDKVCKREPNAYMAMLYFDTELYRRKKTQTGEKDTIDYKKKVLELMSNEEFFDTREKKRILAEVKATCLKYGLVLGPKQWKTAYEILVGGDPKNRTYRSWITQIFSNLRKDIEHGK